MQSSSNQFEIGKNDQRLTVARVTRRMYIFRNTTGIWKIHLHCHTGDIFSNLASKPTNEVWDIFMRKNETLKFLTWKPYRINKFSFYWIQRNGKSSVKVFQCWNDSREKKLEMPLFTGSRHILSIVISLTFHLNDTLKGKFYRTGKFYLIQKDQCILKARFAFHLILGYFVKTGLDYSRRGYC